MKLLLDTHVFIWWDIDPAKISPAAMAALRDPGNSVFLSVVSVWEMVIKVELGKLILHHPLSEIIASQQENGIEVLPVELRHSLAVARLPSIHKDPFDRLLIAQSNVESMEFVSADRLITGYPVQILW